MARRKTVPTVGNKQLHPVQLSPEIRHLEAKRTKAAAQRAAAPVLAADRGKFGVAKKQYQNEAASARGATNAEESALAQALSGLKGAGLKGTALQQTKSEFTSRAADAASALPSLLAGAAEERNKTLAADRQNLITDRASSEQSAAEALNQRLKELRGQGSSALKEEGKHKESAGRSVHNALIVAEDLFNKTVAAAKSGEEVGGQPVVVPSGKKEWLAFAQQVAKEAEGADPVAAVHAVEELRKRLGVKAVARVTSLPLG
jgi:DNA repair exonuclease SbcCD ATPase subunit